MEIRKSQETDFFDIKAIYDSARAYFKSAGIDQWQSGYPSEETILQDIKAGESFVCSDEGRIIGVFMSAKKLDPSYESIADGWWRRDEGYVVLHRVAVHEDYRGKGVASEIVRFVERIFCPDGKGYLKADTHADNLSMQRMLIKNGFQRAGVIRLQEGKEKGAKRVAFDKILK